MAEATPTIAEPYGGTTPQQDAHGQILYTIRANHLGNGLIEVLAIPSAGRRMASSLQCLDAAGSQLNRSG